MRIALLVAAVLASLTPWIGPPIALSIGIVLALVNLTAFPKQTRKWSKLLIQIGVVLLGFRMDLHRALQAGAVGIGFSIGTILLAFALGIVIARALRIDRKVSTLVSSGTAICGGSAIAATGSVIAASESQIAVAMGCIFILNSIGLYIFPPLGSALQLSGTQFGTWAAIAVHDISSVVGSAAVFDKSNDGGGVALETATAIKLSRTLWIIPIALIAGWCHRRLDHKSGEAPAKRPAAPIPWFIGLFVLAAASRSLVPQVSELAPTLETIAKKVLTVALLLIGMGMSIKAISSVGWRAMVLAVTLWLAISVVSLLVVLRTVS